NIGIHVWNGSNSQHFENNFAYNNYIGWIRKDSEGKDIRNDSWFPDCARDQNLNSLCVDNYFYPNPITKALEQEEYKIWLDKLQENNIKIGPQGGILNNEVTLEPDMVHIVKN